MTKIFTINIIMFCATVMAFRRINNNVDVMKIKVENKQWNKGLLYFNYNETNMTLLAAIFSVLVCESSSTLFKPYEGEPYSYLLSSMLTMASACIVFLSNKRLTSVICNAYRYHLHTLVVVTEGSIAEAVLGSFKYITTRDDVEEAYRQSLSFSQNKTKYCYISIVFNIVMICIVSATLSTLLARAGSRACALTLQMFTVGLVTHPIFITIKNKLKYDYKFNEVIFDVVDFYTRCTLAKRFDTLRDFEMSEERYGAIREDGKYYKNDPYQWLSVPTECDLGELIKEKTSMKSTEELNDIVSERMKDI